jgi:hypothetical protein
MRTVLCLLVVTAASVGLRAESPPLYRDASRTVEERVTAPLLGSNSEKLVTAAFDVAAR